MTQEAILKRILISKSIMAIKFIVMIVGIQFIVSSLALADTTYVNGVIDTNTVWTTVGSPYIVIGDVVVDTLVTLAIEPGVEVKLDSTKSIIINGILNAIGTAGDSIIISATDTTKRWSRLWFKPASFCTLKYCRIEHAGKSAIYDSTTSLYIGYNTITNNSAGVTGVSGGVCSYGSPTITYNTISNNSGWSGGICSNGSPTITGNTIINNYAYGAGGGIRSESGSPTITGNTIINNSAGYTGGGIYSYSGSLTITANIIINNSAWGGGAGIYSDSSSTITGNTIAYNFSAYGGGGICSWDGSPTIKYNTIIDTTGCAIYICIHSDSALIDSNNIYATGYAVHNHSSNDINARYNYWGTQSSDTIKLKIWDYYDDSTKGIVYYEPFATDSFNFGVEEERFLADAQNDRLDVYPNPSFGNTMIRYGLPKKADISLKLYDVSGRLVKTVYSGIQEAGWYKENLNLKNQNAKIQSGIYFIQLREVQPQSDEFITMKKFIMLK